MTMRLHAAAVLVAMAAFTAYAHDGPTKPAAPSTSQAAPAAPDGDELTKMARAFVAQLAAGQFDKAVQQFDETMKRVLPAGKLKQILSRRHAVVGHEVGDEVGGDEPGLDAAVVEPGHEGCGVAGEGSGGWFAAICLRAFSS